MAHELQKQIAQDVDRLLPRDKGNTARQTARSTYNLCRLKGMTSEDAYAVATGKKTA
jgi:hypothetical protein